MVAPAPVGPDPSRTKRACNKRNRRSPSASPPSASVPLTLLVAALRLLLDLAIPSVSAAAAPFLGPAPSESWLLVRSLVRSPPSASDANDAHPRSRILACRWSLSRWRASKGVSIDLTVESMDLPGCYRRACMHGEDGAGGTCSSRGIDTNGNGSRASADSRALTNVRVK